MSDTEYKYTLSYFVPNRIAFSITHPNIDAIDLSDLERLFEAGTEFLQSQEANSDVKLLKGSVYTYPRVDPRDCYESKQVDSKKPKVVPQDTFSLVFADLHGADPDQYDPINFIDLTSRLQEHVVRNWGSDAMRCQGVVLDWLTSGSQVPGSTGGPGSWPLPYRDAPERAPFQFHLPEAAADICGNGEGVAVVILDTIWPQVKLDEAYQHWYYKHPLIRSLLNPNHKRLYLHPIPTRLSGLLPKKEDGTDFEVLGHDYKMQDHGLFAAGIVHTIAPKAEIHIVQVLNDYGVGSVDSVAWGLEKVSEIRESARYLVVNCSLTVNLPLGSYHHYAFHEEGKANFSSRIYSDSDRQLEQRIYQQLSQPLPFDRNRTWLDLQRDWLEQSCNNIYARLQSRVIAAAGNDWKPESGRPRPHARLLAALDSVQGVGALPRKPAAVDQRLQTSSYSDIADMPDEVGIVTLGGEPGEGHGLLGIYLGEFPSCDENCTNWAWWAGTSFATPIISGVLAAALSGGAGFSETQEALEALYGLPTSVTGGTRPSIIEDLTPNGEDVLWASQGYSAEPIPISTSTTPPSR